VPVEMHCPQSTIPTSLLGFGVINLMEGCTLSSDDFHYPHTFTSYTDVAISFSLDVPEHKMDGEDYDAEEYGEVPGLPSFHYDNSELPLVIAANEAEIEDDEYEYTEGEEDFSEDVTTNVSVETSLKVVSSGSEDNTKAMLVTKDDFVEGSEAETETPNVELKVVPEMSDTETELHHEVLLKLRNKIKNGKHWLDDFTRAVREIRANSM
jgi:hypothetical protein